MIALCIVKYTSHSLLRLTEPGNGGDFDFLAAVPWYDTVLTAHLPDWGVVTNDWCAYFFRLYALVICDQAPAQSNVEDNDFVSAVPHSNHHTVGTASWQNHDSSPPQSVILLSCHVCRGLSNPYISSALWRQCKSKNATHLPGNRYPRPAQGLGEQWLQTTDALFIAFNALRMKI